jgi:hypothetical protein
VGVFGIKVADAAGVGVALGGLSVGVNEVVGVDAPATLADGMDGSTRAVGVELPVGCAKLIGWHEDKNVNRSTMTTNFLSTFGVYHKIYSNNLD